MTTLSTAFLKNLKIGPKQAGQISHLGEMKARFAEFAGLAPETLETLRLMAMVESTESSNRIEGIITTRQRIEALVLRHATPKNRDEEEIIGYRDALELIHSSHGDMPTTNNVILQLHTMVYRATQIQGGHWKNSDNVIKQINPDGTEFIRFRPVSALQTPGAMNKLLEEYGFANQENVTALLSTPLFILDFLCIHPFNDGNGRVSRLLTLLLLYHAGYTVGRYISLERVIEETKGAYYEALFVGSQGWHEGKHDVGPWLSYCYAVLIQAYRELEQRATNIKTLRGAKSELVRQVINSSLKPFAFNELQSRCPGVGPEQIKNVLQKMKAEGAIRLQGRGRSALWMRTFK